MSDHVLDALEADAGRVAGAWSSVQQRLDDAFTAEAMQGPGQEGTRLSVDAVTGRLHALVGRDQIAAFKAVIGRREAARKALSEAGISDRVCVTLVPRPGASLPKVAAVCLRPDKDPLDAPRETVDAALAPYHLRVTETEQCRLADGAHVPITVVKPRR